MDMATNQEKATAAVDKAISELIGFDLIVVENDQAPPSKYVEHHRHEYIRTVRDVLNSRPASDKHPTNVLEIGAFK